MSTKQTAKWAALAVVVLFVACGRSQQGASDLNFAVGDNSTQRWTTKELNAGADSNVASSRTIDELKARHRNGAYEIIDWQLPRGAASNDVINLVTTAPTGMDGDVYLVDANGRVVASSASAGEVERVTSITTAAVRWPAKIFVSAYGPAAKVGRINVTGTIIGTEIAANDVDRGVAAMERACNASKGTFLSRGESSRCQCNGNVVTFDRFERDGIATGDPAGALQRACNATVLSESTSAMQGLCKKAGGDFLDRGESSRCQCNGNVITLARFRDELGGSSASESVFNAQCSRGNAGGDPVTSFRNACAVNEGAVLSGSGTQSACDCRGWTLFYAGFKSGYVDRGKTATDYRLDCSAAMR